MTFFAKLFMKLLSIIIGIPVAIAVRKVVQRIWLVTRPKPADETKRASGPAWADAVAYAALTAASAVITQLITRRGAEAAYRGIVGDPPPSPKPSRAEKRMRKLDAKAEAA